MNSEENRKRLERQARALILNKDISAADREKINSFMRNAGITHEERYTGIINILRRSPDKEITGIEEDDDNFTNAAVNTGLKKGESVYTENKAIPSAIPVSSAAPARKFPDINGPTETKLFINDIHLKYKKLKLFKKKYLVRRDNWLGLGWSKRLIPTKKLITLMSEIRSFQETILTRLPQILDRILKDETAERPMEFNYLRQLRRWMIISPLASLPYDKINLMEQWDFERELKPYVVYFHSFLRVDVEHRELVLAIVEKFLREEPDLLKEDILENDDRSITIRKENDNYRKEKYIFEYLGTFRSFMAVHGEADSIIAAFLKKKYDIFNLEELLNITLEALVFQRPFSGFELREYFEIRTLSVSSEIWDLSNARLKVYGKDPESKRKKKAEKLQKELLWYDTLYNLIKLDDSGQSILVKSAEDLWKYVDRINRDAEETCKNNYIVFLEGIIHYFKNLLVPVLCGKPLLFDYYGETVEGSLFTQDFFPDELREIDLLAVSIYNFRNANPTLKITRDEIKRIITGKISSMNHVEGLVFKTGSSFYALGRKLHEVYHNHLTTAEKSEKRELRTIPLRPEDLGSDLIIPFSGCLFSGFEPPSPLLKRITGRKILNDTMKGGVMVFIMAYCYQTAYICGYPQIENDLGKRDFLRKEIRDLTGDNNASKR